ncbi:rSAM/selenodomain-associated transferase 2 [Dyadobacter jejuensis]|uniref:RSAM/selenodomain-associated transferase 2 n=1 Tax=Dyadobacter jejuensis TaxID=1082580 RepID=A0A316AN40_9BACT|nr:TIGR04283 family arsenosugar biosynthesis glycosyltransferase [Dyadobacter jejuensis]PWJ58729.1 rSAM/selenodomain-associated transferase 2 [Dyadobacter jejuensis]
MEVPYLSIIIPVINEAESLPILLGRLQELNLSELWVETVVVDGGSSDGTPEKAVQYGAQVVTSAKGRARQMNAGARVARGKVLYFLHADSIPPHQFVGQIAQAHDKGFMAGCFRLKFDWSHWFLRCNAWFTRFNIDSLRFGDQSLYVDRAFFERVGGYDESLIIMEDQEIVFRLTAKAPFRVLPDYIVTSARKYRLNGPYRMQAIFYSIYLGYYLGFPQQKLVRIYKKLIRT